MGEINLIPMVKKLYIVDKNARVLRFGDVMCEEQYELLEEVNNQINAKRPLRIIVLKARQIGISTTIEAILFSLSFLIPRLRGLVVSHERDSAEHLLGMTNNYWEFFFAKDAFTLKYGSKYNLAWKETGSDIKIATAKNMGAGRSRTIQFLHASEVAFWPHPKTLMAGLSKSIPQSPKSFIFIESTANGIGNYFHETWEAAENGDSDYTPLFFPWYKHKAYSYEYTGLGNLVLGRLDEEERVLKRLGVTDGQLAWRRYTIKNECRNDIEEFHQEYPATSEEAFVTTGRNVFPAKHLRVVYDEMDGVRGRLIREGNKVRFQPDYSGPVTIFKGPSNDQYGDYFVAGDPTRTTQGDNACAQVLNRHTWEQVAVWHGKIDPVNFGDEICKLGWFYNTAMVTSEIEGPGHGTIARILSLNYPNVWRHQKAYKLPGTPDNQYGWSSTWRTKNEAVGNLLKVVVDNDIIIHHKQTMQEMKNFITLSGGGFGNSRDEAHDDTVMALAICITCVLYEAAELMGGGLNKKMQQEKLDELVRYSRMQDIAEVEEVPPWELWGKRNVG